MQQTNNPENELSGLTLEERAKALEMVIDDLEEKLEEVSSRPPSSPPA